MTETAVEFAHPEDARLAVKQFASTIGALLSLVEQETSLVRSGRMRQATLLEPQKSDLARAYMKDSARMSAGRRSLTRPSRSAPATLLP